MKKLSKTSSLSDLKKQFKNPDLLTQALTHRSWINENPNIRDHNERLEFLGDAVLELAVSNHIFHKLSDKEEGFLSALRANLVNTHNLSKVATKLNLGNELFLSKGEENGGGRTNKNLLADTVEAVIGAIYIDRGYTAAEEFILNMVLSDLEEILKKPLKDPKGALQELVQANGDPLPRYIIIEESGPDHDKFYKVEVKINDKVYATGEGKSKSEAEGEAAKAALAKFS